MKIFNLKGMGYTDIVIPKIDTQISGIVLDVFDTPEKILTNIKLTKSNPILDRYFESEDQRTIMMLLNGAENALGDDAFDCLEVDEQFMKWFNDLFLGWDKNDVLKVLLNAFYNEIIRINSSKYFPNPQI